MDDDDSSADDLMQPALLIANGEEETFDLDIPPTSGSEYLRRVRMEAKDCPKIVVADIDISPFQSKQTVKVSQSVGCHPAPKGFASNMAWQKAQVNNFAELRQQLARQRVLREKQGIKENSKLPLANDVEGWCRLCFGRLVPPGSRPKEENSVEMQTDNSETNEHTGTLPYLNIIIAMDQTSIIKVLEYHINWFEVTGFSQKQGTWFYALLCCLQKPLTPEACSLLRSLARGCANLRATLDSPEDPRLPALNLFICLVSRYFDQMDLADNVT